MPDQISDAGLTMKKQKYGNASALTEAAGATEGLRSKRIKK
jgi:hypothetical protein